MAPYETNGYHFTAYLEFSTEGRGLTCVRLNPESDMPVDGVLFEMKKTYGPPDSVLPTPIFNVYSWRNGDDVELLTYPRRVGSLTYCRKAQSGF